jgi:glycosyltransferase 2 family protein
VLPVPTVASTRRAFAKRLGLDPDPDPAHGVEIIDTPSVMVHHQADLLNFVLSTLGIGVMILLAIYAHGTTQGVTQDVRGVSTLLRNILLVPANVLEGLLTVAVPILVLTELAIRRLGRQVLEALAAAVLGLLLAVATLWLVRTWGSTALVSSLTVVIDDKRDLAVPALLSAIAGLLTAAGTRARRRTVRWSWNLLWIVLGISLITGQISLPGAVITVLLGRVAGLAVRFAAGVYSERAYGAELVAGIRRAGFQPVRLVRVDGNDDEGHLIATATERAQGPSATALARSGDKRVYEMTTGNGERFDVIALDGDRQVIGQLGRFWRSLRLRGIDRRRVVSLRQVAERSALLGYTARAAGVRTPRIFGLAEAADSMLLVQQHPLDAVPLSDIPESELTDAVLDRIWRQVQLAHEAGIAHRALTADVVLLGGAHSAVTGRVPEVSADDIPNGDNSPIAQVWLTSWENGDVASSDLARRMDLVQLVALLALRVGADRALASAARIVSDEQLAAIGPLLQTVGLPRSTRDEARKHKGIIAELRIALVNRVPAADVEPQPLVKFGARRVLMIAFALAAAFVILAVLNIQEISASLHGASPWWTLVAFTFGMITFLGAAMNLIGFSPVRLNSWHVLLTEIAASFVAAFAPAGVGPATLNLRLLTKRGASGALAVATVALIQVSGFLVTVGLLVTISLATGSGGALRQLPSAKVLTALLLLAAALGIVFAVPTARRWVLKKIVPSLQQMWPRLAAVLGQPGRLAMGLGGSLVVTAGYLAAFYASIHAFGQSIPLVELTLIYLLASAIGSALPTPGGMGGTEAALSVGLANAGIASPIAFSIAVLLRVLTYYIRIPMGWFAMRYLERRNIL